MISRSPWLKRFLVLGLLSGLWLGGCTTPTTPPRDARSPAAPTENKGEKKKVLVTFSVLADMVQNVAGDKIQVESLTRIGTQIHGYEPTPSDLVRAQGADLLFYNGMGLERWFEKFLGNVQGVPAVSLTEGITPIAITEGNYQNQPNPHAWMSPQNALIYVENIRKALVELDPAHGETYNANARAYSAKIQAIADQLAGDLAKVPEKQRYLVSCEGAFSYLARDYGLKEIYLWPINTEQQYSPKQMQRVIDQVKTNQIPAVFCESTVSDKAQREVVQTTGAAFGGNLYVDSLSPLDGPVPTFLELLTYDARTITTGLQARSP